MKSVDFPGIIAAAAVSTLGVLSLIVLGVGLLAWAFFKGSGDNVKIGVFAAILVAAAGFGAATIHETRSAGAGDYPASDAMANDSEPTQPVPSPAEPAPPDPAPASPPPTRSATSEAGPSSPTPDPLSYWDDSHGYAYAVTTTGSRTRGTIYKDNVEVGYTEGTISGSNARFRFVNSAASSAGDCSALVSPDGSRMDGSCSSNLGPFGFYSVRRR